MSLEEDEPGEDSSSVGRTAVASCVLCLGLMYPVMVRAASICAGGGPPPSRVQGPAGLADAGLPGIHSVTQRLSVTLTSVSLLSRTSSPSGRWRPRATPPNMTATGHKGLLHT